MTFFLKESLLFVKDKGQILHFHSQMLLLPYESMCVHVFNTVLKNAIIFRSLHDPIVCTAKLPASICEGRELSIAKEDESHVQSRVLLRTPHLL